MSAVGIDVGGTAIKGVRVEADLSIGAERSITTPKNDPSGHHTADAIVQMYRSLAVGPDCAIGFTSPGLVDERRGVTVDSVNLGWREVPIRSLVEDRLGRSVGFGHDVRAGGLAELRAVPGVDPGFCTAFVPIGTGLAAAIFLGQTPIVGKGWAGEIGQITFTSGPHQGKRYEEVASAAVLASRMGTRGAAEVAQLVRAGDPRAVEVWDDTAAAVAQALAALVATVAPDIVILGGGLAESGELLFTPVKTWLGQYLPDVPLPPFRAATFGRLAGARGAAILGLEAGERHG